MSVEKDVIADCDPEVHVTNDLFDSLSVSDRYLEEAIELLERLGGSEGYWVAEDAATATMNEETRSEKTEKTKEASGKKNMRCNAALH